MEDLGGTKEVLYQDTLERALKEVQDLSREIEHLRTRLTQLERRKCAVEEICDAIGAWVEVSEDLPEAIADIPVPSLDEPGKGLLPLTEEEVSLIAFSDGVPQQS
ncbi:MAG: hypothetical protein QGI83_18315 [Candidatus Latescibacteria bacterium]|jgi:hypothetical protein|nr:hypothetical protein [Candidatus Latescibacterota bacterium]